MGSKLKPTEQQASNKHDNQGRENSPYSAQIEIQIIKLIPFQISKDDARNQITGDDKEDINSDISSFYPFGKKMESYNQRHRDCTKSVNIGSITQTRARVFSYHLSPPDGPSGPPHGMIA